MQNNSNSIVEDIPEASWKTTSAKCKPKGGVFHNPSGRRSGSKITFFISFILMGGVMAGFLVRDLITGTPLDNMHISCFLILGAMTLFNRFSSRLFEWKFTSMSSITLGNTTIAFDNPGEMTSSSLVKDEE